MEQLSFNQDWIGADTGILRIQNHSNLSAGDLVAYQGVISLYSKQIFFYRCILKDKRKSPNPYHLGTFTTDQSNANYDCIEREYQLSVSGWWRQTQPPKGSPAYPQWMAWTWENCEEDRLFAEWHIRDFEKKLKPSKAQIITSIPPITVEYEQLTLF
ncbi:hypothetical protein [Paenibacillus glacialis]|uniref:Uncharacterized protein n=1 Tax=Paenibacillus glacialis TaxID=494026 RepID=A0A168MCH0_9BACL|nr:hypothetical protein [Paenibacillus glacialis]OAB44509.1 hypothetical protein PGLA_07595 [Paenibacillus glacialis]